MSLTATHARVDQLIARLDDAVDAPNEEAICQRVKDALIEIIGSREEFIPAAFLQPTPDRYARRLLHKDPSGRYTVLVMVWGVGQGTPLHDHAGNWCVECVYRGRIRVVSYDIRSAESDPVIRFERQTEVHAGPGDAGALIPPFDYHTIENASSAPTITIHVYGGEMRWCNAFMPVDGGYRLERRKLNYTTDVPLIEDFAI